MAVLAALGAAAVTAPVAAGQPSDHPTVVERFEVLVSGELARGVLAYPTDREPSTLLVYGHGCCGRLAMARIDERLAFARTHGAAVIAMEYRGSGGWDVAAGAADVVAATEVLQRRFPIQRTVAWGHSMGAEVTAMAVADRPDLFDWWVGTAGVYDLAEQWATPGFRHLIEGETGGTPFTRPAAYRQRSPVQLARAMKGIRGAVLVHGAADPIALPGQARRMADALNGAGVPVRLHIVPIGDSIEAPMLPGTGMTRVPAPLAPAGHDGAVAARSAAIVGELLRPATAGR